MTEPADGVLLIHAFPLDAGMWERQVRTLEDAGWPVAAPSLPGFGDTDGVGPTMTMGAAADRCLQAADAAGIERFVVVRAVDGRLRSVRTLADGSPADRRARPGEHAIGRRRAGGRPRPARAGRPPGCRRATGSWWSSRRRSSVDQASDELWEQVRDAIAGAARRLDRGCRARHGRADRLHTRPRGDRRPDAHRDLLARHLDPGRGLGRDA